MNFYKTITKRSNRSPFIAYATAATILVFLSAYQPGQEVVKKISVSEFGALPNDGQNDAATLRKAMAFCKENPGTTLTFPPGVYNFRDALAVGLMEGILTGKVPGNPQDSIFRPYYPYAKGLDFNGLKDVTVEAAGAVLMCEGWMEPVSLNNCDNIKITGLTIDYNRKPNSEGTITVVRPDWFEAEFDSSYTLFSRMSLPRILVYDTLRNRMLPWDLGFPKSEIAGPQKLRIFKRVPENYKGMKIASAHTFHFRPAILMLEAKQIELKDVTIHSQPGMGIVGHRSENIQMNGLRIVPDPGSVMSTNTDATHFTSCKGYIKYINCQFQGHGDDAVNIHNYYYTIERPKTGKGYDLRLKGADWHAQVLDYPDPKDTLELVRAATLEVVKKVVVRSRENSIEQLKSYVTLSESLPDDIEKYYLINVSRLPAVEITGCTVTNNRSRGFLIKTRNVLIEHNLIRESSGTGIHVGAEGGWHEGPAAENIRIRYNRIVRCGTGPGTINGACGIAVEVSAKDQTVSGIHKNILIEGNIIEGENAVNGISIAGARDVIVRYNEIAGCKTPVSIEHSTNVRVNSNPGVADFKN